MSKSELTKRRIIEKSASLFNTKGVAGTSLSDIMEVTGLTKGGLYGNFSSKDEIAIAAFHYAVEEVWKSVRERTNVIENTLDKLKAVVYFYKERIFSPPVKGGCPILNTAVEADDNYPVLREKVIEAMEQWKNTIVKSLLKGQQKGEVKKDIELEKFATLFISNLEGGMMMARIYGTLEPFNLVARQLIDMIEELRPQ